MKQASILLNPLLGDSETSIHLIKYWCYVFMVLSMTLVYKQLL